ncbi:hypothetical protein [Arthrobacter sp. ok362]|uniref:hypothetical protein n=1 Tax=Arthrobacter sp. ok362 TaxID=1761745 RepID=UPI0020C8739C|nr:hypothetical protein [Arthrobacter sp. ok362]
MKVFQSAAVGAGVAGAEGASVGGTSVAPGADVSGGTEGIDGDVGPGPAGPPQAPRSAATKKPADAAVPNAGSRRM